MGVPGTQETAAANLESAAVPISDPSTDAQQERREVSSVQLNEAEDPQSWPSSKKWLCTIVLVAMPLTVGFCSSIHTAAVTEVAQSFNCSRTVAALGVSTFLLGFATGPLIFGPLSEAWGRNPIYRSVLLLFVVFNAACAVAPNIAALLVFRFFCGFFSSPTVTNSGGSLTDMWPTSHRSVPLALFTAASFLGPVIAPIVGGFVAQYSRWQWDYWIVTILSGISYIATLALLPETYAPVILEKKRIHLGGDRNEEIPKIDYYVTLTRPWVMLFTEPILFLLSLYMAFCYGILYLDFTAYPIVFAETRNWSPGFSGLSFLGIGIGMTIATASSPLINRIHTHYAAKLRHRDNISSSSSSPPEARLPHLIVISWFIPLGLLWFAWTSAPPHHWAIPIAAGIPFGIGFVTLFLAITAYLTDCYGRKYAASALAANAVLRSLFGAVFPLFARQMYEALGTAWATSVLGFMAVAMTPLPWAFYVWGPWLRGRSGFHVRAVGEDEEGRGGGRASGRRPEAGG